MCIWYQQIWCKLYSVQVFGSETSDALTPEEEAAFLKADELRAVQRHDRGLARPLLGDCSKELAQHMLNGWTLTDEHCPRCAGAPRFIAKGNCFLCLPRLDTDRVPLPQVS